MVHAGNAAEQASRHPRALAQTGRSSSEPGQELGFFRSELIG